MKSILTKAYVLSLLCALPALANDVGLHNSSAQPTRAVPAAGDALIANAQVLLDQVKTEINLSQGEVMMFIADMPNEPPQNVPVMIAQANQANQGDMKTLRTIGICFPAPNELYSLENVVEPKGDAGFYLRSYEHKKVANTDPGTITILQQPKHGILRLVTEADRGALFDSGAAPLDPAAGLYAYFPEKGYLGKDKAVALVEIGGVKVKVVYFFQAIDGPLGDVDQLCGKKGYHWKISTNLDANGNSTLTSIDYLPSFSDDAVTLASMLGEDFLNSLAADTYSVGQSAAFSSYATPTYTFTNLPGTSVGQTTGEGTDASILLDIDAAGHGWFLDSTPFSNEEYLPTSNPNEWIARVGGLNEMQPNISAQ